jgi:probable phosphoglycerate mutase
MPRRVLYLVRHGETDWNVAGRWQGQTDIPLNEEGRRQANAVADGLLGLAVAGIVSSDLSRAEETARIVGERIGRGLVYVDARLRERSFGPFEGLTRADCARLHPEAWQAWTREQDAPPGAERLVDVSVRVLDALRRAAETVATDAAAALVVSHGAAMRAAIGHASRVKPPPIANGAVWRVEWHEGIVDAAPLPLRDGTC